MSIELFNAEQTPFNLQGEQIDNGTTAEGEARVRALAEREARKAQTVFDIVPPCEVCGGILSHKDGCRFTGRRVTL